MLKTAEVFQDGMVLQRGKAVSVWGTSDAGKEITVTIQGKRASATADEEGRWKVILEPLTASFQENMTVNAENEQICFRDVAVGEVWLAAGQSNMEFHMAYKKHFAQEKEVCQDEFLRFYDVPEIAYDGQMEQFDYSKVGIWRKSTPEDIAYFSAVGYYFAKDLRKKLNVPVAILGCNWGGTSIVSWLSRESLENVGKPIIQDFEKQIADMDLDKYWEKQLKDDINNRATPLEDAFSNFVMPQTVMLEELDAFFGDDPSLDEIGALHPEAFPGVLYERMVKTILPYAIQGVLWYQGESDDVDGRREVYDKLLMALISEWRKFWMNSELPFLVVQLPRFKTWIGLDNFDFATIHEKQKQVADLMPDVWLCSISDIGEEYDIHPKEKRTVGNRLALLAMGHVYNENILCDPPVVTRAVFEKNQIQIVFEQAGDGLYIEGQSLEALEIRQSGEFIPFSAETDKDRLVLTLNKDIEGEFSVEFAQGKWYTVNLYNSVGIPAIPFKLELTV